MRRELQCVVLGGVLSRVPRSPSRSTHPRWCAASLTIAVFWQQASEVNSGRSEHHTSVVCVTNSVGCQWASGWLLPAVSEVRVVLDLIESRVESSKLASDTLDCGPHIRPIAQCPSSCDETIMAQAVIDVTVPYVPTPF